MIKKSLLVAALATTASLAIANTTTTTTTTPAVKKAVHKAHKKATHKVTHKKATVKAAPAPVIVIAKPVLNNNANFAGINAGIGIGGSNLQDRTTTKVAGEVTTTHDRGNTGFTTAADASYLFPIAANWVLGPEAHAQYNPNAITSNMSGLRSVQYLRWNYGAAAKLGFATSQDNMLFAVVGPEWGSFYTRTATTTGNNAARPTVFGWAAGVGAEQALTSNLHISEQMNYASFKNTTSSYGNEAVRHSLNLTTGLVSLVYHFA